MPHGSEQLPGTHSLPGASSAACCFHRVCTGRVLHSACEAEARGVLFGFLLSDVKSFFPGKCFPFPWGPLLVNQEQELQRHTTDF